jgi:hypothetical protein
LPFAGWLCARFSCSPAVSVLVPALQQALLLTQSKHKGVKTNLPSPPILESAPLLYPSSSPDGTGSMMLSALANRNGCPSRTRKNKGFDLPYRLHWCPPKDPVFSGIPLLSRKSGGARISPTRRPPPPRLHLAPTPSVPPQHHRAISPPPLAVVPVSPTSDPASSPGAPSLRPPSQDPPARQRSRGRVTAVRSDGASSSAHGGGSRSTDAPAKHWGEGL